MLKIITKFSDLDVSALMDVYSLDSAFDPGHDSQRELYEQQYSFLLDFLSVREQFIAVWIENGVYVSALRMQPYRDGYLISGLETEPTFRNCGYGTRLLQESLLYLAGAEIGVIYSHVEKENKASLRVHDKSGFVVLSDCAALLDGSASDRYYTLQRKKETPLA